MFTTKIVNIFSVEMAGTDSDSRRSSSHSSNKRSKPDTERHREENKRRKDCQQFDSDPQAGCASQSSLFDADPPSQPAPPQDVNSATAPQSPDFSQLTALLSTVIQKLDTSAQASTSQQGFSGAHVLSSSEEEEGELTPVQYVSDPFDDLDTLGQRPASTIDEDDAFSKALGELSAHFHGEEEKGEPLSERLASILNDSLRRRPSSEAIKLTCSKIQLPRNVPNLCVPSTNSAITKALSTGGKLLDNRLFQTNGLLSKALVLLAQCVSDIGERAGKPLSHYLEGFNNSIRLLVSAINFLNHMRKEVARLHVHDSALTDLCKWDCDVGTDALFPFDIAKKCDEIHKTKRLGRPSFRPHKSRGPRWSLQNRQPAGSRRPLFQRADSRSSRLFLGQTASQGRGMRRQTSQ